MGHRRGRHRNDHRDPRPPSQKLPNCLVESEINALPVYVIEAPGFAPRADRRCPWVTATPDSATSNRRLADSGTGNPGFMIGRLRSVVVNYKDPKGLAAFYSGVLGGTIKYTSTTRGWC